MLHVDVTLADHRIIADFKNKEIGWEVRIINTFDGEECESAMTPIELGALLALVTAGEDIKDSENLYHRLYDLVEETIGMLPSNLRPIE